MMDLFFSDQCVLTPRAGTSAQGGAPIWGNPVPSSCRFQQEMANAGSELLSESQVFLPGGTAMEVGWKVTYGGRDYEARHVARKRTLDWEDHVFVHLGPFRK